MNIARTLKTYRRENGLSQERCAEILGVDTTTISRWERGVVTPGPAALARIFATIKPRTGFDAQIHRIVRSSPCLMQLLLPTTEILAVSPSYENFARSPASEIIGTLEIADLGERVLADFENAGGIEHVLESAESSAGSDIWRPNNFSNRSGRTMHLYFSAQLVFLDDGRPAILETSVILPDDADYMPLNITPARTGEL
ncbi:MAG: helix-turn-helix domain-containing protein [Hyphomicrobium sp.]